MSFFQRVISYVANELLVNRLANRRGHRRIVSLSSPGALLTPGLPRSQYIFPTLRHQNRQDADRVAGYGCDHRPRNVAIFSSASPFAIYFTDADIILNILLNSNRQL